jgi:CRISPR-associated protein Cas1
MENDINVGFRQGQIVIEYRKQDHKRTVPFATIEGISVYGRAQLSTQLLRECLKANICVDYYSEDGHYFGKLSGFNRTDPQRQKQQIYMTDNTNFALQISKKIVTAKLSSSLALLKTYNLNMPYSETNINGIRQSATGIKTASTIDEVIGYEGNAAKNYFACLDKLIEQPRLKLNGRTSHPPKKRRQLNAFLRLQFSL